MQDEKFIVEALEIREEFCDAMDVLPMMDEDVLEQDVELYASLEFLGCYGCVSM